MPELPRLMQTTPGITIPNFSREPLMTEGEATPGDPDENPFEQARELRERAELEQQKRANEGKLLNTVPNPANPDLPPATINENPTRGDDPFVFDDVEEEVNSLGLPGVEGGFEFPDFGDGDMFRF